MAVHIIINKRETASHCINSFAPINGKTMPAAINGNCDIHILDTLVEQLWAGMPLRFLSYLYNMLLTSLPTQSSRAPQDAPIMSSCSQPIAFAKFGIEE